MFRSSLFAAVALTATVCPVKSPAQSIDAYNPMPGSPPTSLAIQADGKVLVVGSFLSIGSTTRTRVARLNTDGSLDASFADPNSDSEVKTIAVQSDGKLLIGGGFAHVGGQPRHGLARLNDDGSLDATFVDPGLDSNVRAIAIQPDGKILAGGDFSHIGATAQNYFARFTANGDLDSSFPDPQLCCNVVFSVALQADGHILIGGYFTHAGGVDGHAYLARFSTTGVFDPSFPNVPENIVLLANDMVIAPDGSILLPGSGAPAVRKLNADGTLDTAFNATGTDSSVNGIALQPNGKFLIAGNFQQVGGQPHHALARLNADGSLDATFADVQFSFSATNPNGTVNGIAIQADGKIVAIGNFPLVAGASRQYMARVVTADSATSRLSVQPSGSSVIATWTRSGDGPELAQAPTLMHSTDGVNFAAVGPMARVSNGWQATAPYNLHGALFYLQATGTTSGGAENGSPGRVASDIYFSDTIFEDGFE